ncbi:MAG: TfoX/Sxy family protein [Propionibacteriaceae bacterium]
MAYDVELADRLREQLVGEPDVTEKTMFGGRAFLVGGHLTVCAGSHGGLMLRVDPTQAETLLTDSRARPFVMRGRELTGWLLVDVDATVTDDQLGRWVEHSLEYVGSLPPK